MKYTKSQSLNFLLSLLVSAACFFVGNLYSGEKNSPAISPSEILLPPDNDKLSWRYNAKITSFAGGNRSSLYNLNTEELIKWRIGLIQKEGANTVIINGLHMHHCFLERWPEIVKYVKTVTRLAHANGIKVIFHHDVPLVFNCGSGLEYLLKHVDWLQRDIQYDRPAFNGFCFNNPEFRKSYFDRITDLVKETDVDGVMLDEVSFIDEGYCGCKYCRKRFTMDTGLTLPEKNDSPVFFNKNDHLWVEWLRWRKRTLGDWWVDIRKRFNTIKPDLCIMIYTTHYGFAGNGASLKLGLDIAEVARGCDFLGTEIMSYNVYDSYRSVYALRKAKTGLRDFYGSPVWGLIYHGGDPVYAYFGWAINHMNCQETWMLKPGEEENISRYLDWPKRMNCRYAESISDIAVVFSRNERDSGRVFRGMDDMLGTSQCLSDAHLQHDIIMNDALLDTLKLSRYKIIILACVGNMTEKEVQAVRQYVAGGGILFVSGQTSLFDKDGFKQNNFQLADVMGVDNDDKPLYSAPMTIRRNSDGVSASIPVAALKVKLRKNSESFAEFIDEKGKIIGPAIVSNRYGKGQCLYSTVPMGIANCQPEYKLNMKMNFKKNQGIYDFYISLLKGMTNDNLVFRGLKIPENVLVNIWRQNANGKREILVHLLNATGTGIGLKQGDVIPGKSDWKKRGTPFPALREDIVFDIRPDANILEAVIVSPDYKDERPAIIEKKDNGYYRVTVKKEDLQAYSIVYLKLSNN